MNIYRHEMIERLGKQSPDRYAEWRGSARKLAEGDTIRRSSERFTSRLLMTEIQHRCRQAQRAMELLRIISS
jgi:hypothetical protein